MPRSSNPVLVGLILSVVLIMTLQFRFKDFSYRLVLGLNKV